MKSICYLLFTAAMLVFTACSSDDNGPLPFTIIENDIQIENVCAIKIASGNLDYTIDVKDPEVIKVTYFEPYDKESYGDLYFVPRKTGKTVVTVTDNVCKTSISLQVEVLEKNTGSGTLIESSNHPLLAEGSMLVFFAYDTSRRFSIKEPKGDTYLTKKEGKYSLEYQEGNTLISLTYKDDNEKEVTETYDTGESDSDAIATLSTDLRWEYGSQTRLAMPNPEQHNYLRMKGKNNEYKISALVSIVK